MSQNEEIFDSLITNQRYLHRSPEIFQCVAGEMKYLVNEHQRRILLKVFAELGKVLVNVGKVITLQRTLLDFNLRRSNTGKYTGR